MTLLDRTEVYTSKTSPAGVIFRFLPPRPFLLC